MTQLEVKEEAAFELEIPWEVQAKIVLRSFWDMLSVGSTLRLNLPRCLKTFSLPRLYCVVGV